jgi:TonB family protein
VAKRQGIRRGSRRSFAGLLITLALHAGIFAAVAVAHGKPQPPLIVSRDFVVAEMVKLGKPRDKFWLPRITQPPRSKAPPDTLKVTEDPNAKAAPKEAPRPEDPEISKDVKRALEHARRWEALAVPEEPDEGAANGSKFGASNRAEGDQYLAQIKGMLIQAYKKPAGVTAATLNPPEIQFHIRPDGTVADIKLTKSSGNSLIDDACVSAAQQIGKVPQPPSTIHGTRVTCEEQ